MKCKLLIVALIATASASFAQNKSTLWNATTKKSTMVPLEARMQLPENNLFDLNLTSLKTNLSNAPARLAHSKSNSIISLPNADGVLERYTVYENSSMDSALAARYPEIKSYIGIGIDNPAATAHFSISPLGFKSMVLAPDKSAVFIEPISADLKTYSVYRKSDKTQAFTPFECSVIDTAIPEINGATARPNADDAVLRTFRLAMSCTGEYTAYFGGTKALALAAINNSITRCNGVFEKDFGARLIIIANTDLVIYTSASTDPYAAAASMSQWNAQLQSTLTSVIGEANYDIGHLFGATGGGGNAGCIGCICTNGSKGSGITSPADGIPMGDNFDIDYVAHEIGHQMGANHTFTHSNEGTGVQMEPGSGSTIMGYAGITTLDVQPHSDAYFHAVSIQQVTNNIKAKTCSVNIATGNAVPTASAGLDYTIPKSTPFMLTATGTDANGDALTYNWEQMDSQTTSAVPSATKTTGVDFRSYNSSTSPTRYFPRMASVLTGATTTAGSELTVEALPSVARTMNFRVTVRDNRAGGPANNSDDMIVTVNATAGPFSVTSPNTAVSYAGGSSQTVTWAVAGTTANGVNCANVDILLSTDAGNTWSTILAATPNDGTEAVTIPNTPGTTNRIMVKGSNHIFFDVSNTNFTITAGSTDTVAPSTPLNLIVSGTTQTTTNLSWTASTDNVGVTGYNIYQGVTLIGTSTTTSYTVTGLTPSTAYTFAVSAKDAAGNVSGQSASAFVTTLAPVVDTTAPTAPTLAASGTTSSSTNLSWSGATDNVGVTGYDVYKDGVFLASTTSTTYAVTGLSSLTAYSFYVQAKDAAGNVSLASNTTSITTLAVSLSYCASQGNSIADEYIGRVQIGAIDNASGGVTGYVDYTSLSTDLTIGANATITVTPTWTATAFSEGYAVFIDYNQDGDFADAGETVWSKATSTTTPAVGTFTVPATAISGPTRMRVSMKYNGTPTSCEVFSYGQVEDYTVNLVAGVADTTAPTAPTLSASGTTQTTTNLSWSGANDNVAVTGYDVYQGSSLLGSTAATTYAVSGLTASTAYTFSVKAKDAAGNISGASNTVSVTTLAVSTNNATDLLFSEYVEGTSNNKALEIANNTGSPVSMSAYSIKKQNNGAGAWSAALTLTGTLNNGAKFVLVHSSINSTCYSAATANISTSATQMTFTGNDAVGLFKNGVLIDIIGTFNGGSANFAANVTLRRKATVTSPNTTFNKTAEWDSYAVDTCGGIGSRVDDIASSSSEFVIYPNPLRGDVLNIANIEDNSTYRIFNMLGQELGSGKIENNAIFVGSLKTGTFLIEVSNENGTATKRFIKE